MPVRIRPIERRDRDEWLRLRQLLLADPSNAPEIDAYLADSPERYAVLVAERVASDGCAAGDLGGFIEVGQRDYAEGCLTSPVGYVEAWYVDQDLRRSGVGAALMQAAERWARGRGFTELASDAIIDNHVSHASHRALGFAEVERIVCFRKEIR